MTVDDEDFLTMQLGLSNSSLIKDLRETYQFCNQENESITDQNLNWLTNVDSRYYEVGEFEKYITKHGDNLSMIHFNTVNLANKHETMCEFLSPIIDKVQIIAVSETKLKDNSSINVSLPGFCDIIPDNSKTSYGGVGLYVSKSLNARPRDDLRKLN